MRRPGFFARSLVRARSVAGSVALLLSALFGPTCAVATSAPPSEVVTAPPLWRIDAGRSKVVFKLRALAVIGIEGTFTAVTGEVWRDAKGEWVEVRVPLSRLSMSSERRRRWALSEEFFDAARHPELRFIAMLPAGKAISQLQGTLRGKLNLRGIEGSQRVELAPPHCADTEQRCLVIADARVSRSRFGMRSRSIVLSDTVELDLRLELERVPAKEPGLPPPQKHARR